MLHQFINRAGELKALEDRFRGPNPEFIIIYGRRRVGKTELVTHFMKGRPCIYYLCGEKKYKDNLNDMKEAAADFLKDEEFRMLAFENWAQMFKSIVSRISKRTVIIIDEFPYLVEEDKSIPSEFQKIWDMHISKSENIMLILVGSSVSMMEKLLAQKSPLFGRRTAQLEIKPLDIFLAGEFLPEYSMEDRIIAYGCLDGIPLYLKQFSSERPVFDNMREAFFRRDALLYNEAEILLKQEFREPSNYFAILKAISYGYTKQNEIADYTDIDKSIISKYMKNLEEIRIIRKEYPVTDRKEKRKNTRYAFIDNYFRFWFRFIYSGRTLIESSPKEAFDTMKKNYNQYLGYIFEKTAEEFLLKKRPVKFTKLGRWWHKDAEIDLVALNEDTKEIIFCECKWQDKVDAGKILSELKEKSKYVDWNNGKRNEYYALFAKSFREKIKEPNVMLFDLADF